MPKIVPIVEGDGETTAIPVLLRKLLDEMDRYDIQVGVPKNAHGRDNLLKPNGLEKFVEYARYDRDCGAVLILIDVEEGCALDVPKSFVERIRPLNMPCPVVVVAANRMYENWFLASLETIRGKTLEGRMGLPADTTYADDCEIPNAKAFITTHLPSGRSYKETLDQEAMTRLLDTSIARENSRSFRRLSHAVEQAVEAIDNGIAVL